MSTDVTIRPALLTDAEATRHLLVNTWHDTYDALLGPDRVTQITDEWHALDVLTRQIGSSASFLVAEHGGGIVAHAFARELPENVLVLSRLYVLPGWQRCRIGTRLLQAMVARHRGAALLRLSVEAGNKKGVAFYHQHGFVAAGVQADKGLTFLRMERKLP